MADQPSKEEIQDAKKILELATKREKLTADQLAKERQRIRLLSQEKQDLEVLRALREKELDLLGKELSIKKSIVEDLQAKLIAEKTKEFGIDKDRIQQLQDELDIQKHYVEELEKRSELLNKQIELEGRITDRTKDLIKASGLVSDNWKNGLMHLVSQYREVGNLRGATQAMLEGMDEMITPTNALAAGIGEVKRTSLLLLHQMDDSQAQFTQQTGLMRENFVQTQETALEYRFLGVNMQNIREASVALAREFSNLNDISSKTRKNMEVHVAQLTNLGASAQSTARLYAQLNKGFGMTPEAVKDVTLELTALAGPGMTAAEAIEGFEENLNWLTRYTGPKAIQVYKGLAAQSKALQTSTTDLVAITEQYDTFEGAATAVGKLNALLGGDYLNSVEMMAASEEERIMMLQESLKMSGKQFDAMNKFEKMAIANAAEIKDLTTLQNMMSMSTAELNQKMMDDQGAKSTQEQFEQLMRDTQSLREDLISIGQTFALTFGPALEMFRELITYVGEADAQFRKWTKGIAGAGVPLIAVVTGLASLYKVSRMLFAGKFLSGISTSMAKLATSSAAAAATTPAAAAGTASLNTAAKGGAAAGAGLLKLSVGLLAAGAGGLMFGAGIKMAGEGMSQFFDSVSKLETDQMLGLAGLMTMFPLMAGVAPLVLVTAASFATLGAGLYAFGEGLKNVTGLEEFTDLLREINELEADKVVTFTNMSKTVTETVAELEEAPNAAEVLANYAVIMNGGQQPAATGNAGAGKGKTHKIILTEQDRFGNERTLKELIVKVINNELNILKSSP